MRLLIVAMLLALSGQAPAQDHPKPPDEKRRLGTMQGLPLVPPEDQIVPWYFGLLSEPPPVASFDDVSKSSWFYQFVPEPPRSDDARQPIPNARSNDDIPPDAQAAEPDAAVIRNPRDARKDKEDAIFILTFIAVLTILVLIACRVGGR